MVRLPLYLFPVLISRKRTVYNTIKCI